MNSFQESNDDDPEMLEAIKAAFGEQGLGMLADDNRALSDAPLDQQGLEELIQEIDDATLADVEATDDIVSIDNSTAAADIDMAKYIVVQICGRMFGIPLANVHEIQRVPEIRFLPGVPDWLLGVTNLRGDVVSVVDLRELLELPPSDAPAITRRLVMTHSLVDDVATGFTVDRVVGIRGLRQDQIMRTQAPVDDEVATYLTGMIDLDDQLVALLDIDKLLLSEQFRQFDAA